MRIVGDGIDAVANNLYFNGICSCSSSSRLFYNSDDHNRNLISLNWCISTLFRVNHMLFVALALVKKIMEANSCNWTLHK